MKKIIKVYKEPTTSKINLPKAMLEETGLNEVDEVSIENKGKRIVIKKVEEND